MKNRSILIIAIIPIVVFILGACEPKPDGADLLNEFVVETNHDQDKNFTSYDSFAIRIDTIGLYSNATDDTYITEHDYTDFVRPIVQKVINNMKDRGFVLVDKSKKPELGINVFIIENYSQYQSVVYGGGYGSGYYGYGGYGYGGYSPSYVQTTTTTRGSINIEIVDLKNKVDNKVKVIWYSTMGDLFNAVDINKQCLDAVDQSFKQSPYIQR